jgi:hypothetical protein
MNSTTKIVLASGAALFTVAAYTLLSEPGTNSEEIVPEDVVSKELPPELRNEILSRVAAFFGEDGLEKLSTSFVVVICLFHLFILQFNDRKYCSYKLGGRTWRSRKSLCSYVSTFWSWSITIN